MSSIAILVPSLKKGGAEKQAALLARALYPDHDVCMLIPFPDAGMEKENIDMSTLSPDRIIAFHGKHSGSVMRLYRELRTRDVEVLFCYLTWSDFWGPIAGRLAGVKTVYQGLRNAELPAGKLMLEKIGNLFSTGAITNNYAGARAFQAKGIKRQTVIPNCYLNPMDAIVRNPGDIVTVITVGRFVRQKDYPVAIKSVAEAMRHDNRIRYKIIGHGELEHDVRNMVEDEGISDRTEILINPPGILGHLVKADIYLSTSLFEGTSNSIMEALDASLPVVATDVGDNDQLVDDGATGFLVNTGDVSAITASLLKLASDRNLRNTMGEKGSRLLKEKYGFGNFKTKYLELLENERHTECD